MTVSIAPRRWSALGFGLLLLSSASFVPGTAQAGFFDQLFGAPAPRQVEPTYESQPAPGPAAPFPGQDAAPPPRLKKKTAVREVMPVRQKTTDLWHDKTLRVGDAIMMKDGLHVYNGPEAAHHSSKEFPPIGQARSVPAAQRLALAAIDTTRSDVSATAPAGLSSGRSAATGTPISKGFKITDARGASIRYVGP